MVDKFVKLVVGYFVYGAAKDTAVGIESGAHQLIDGEVLTYKRRVKQRKIK